MPWNYRETLEGMGDVQTPSEESRQDDRYGTQKCRKALAKRTKDERCLTSLWNWRKRIALFSAGSLRKWSWKLRPKNLRRRRAKLIADATDFDEREINRNFSYDYAAYDEVKRNLSRLVELEQLPLAMELSLELMKQGSYQVEMSDEGMMTQEIEECLQVVLKALKKCDLPPDEVVAWCAGMIQSDRVGCICDRDLGALRNHFKALRSQ